VKLFNAAYVLVATSGAVTASVPTVTLGATTASAGGTVTVNVTNAPGTPGDWAGLFDATGSALQWQFLDGTQTMPVAGVTSATLTFTMPMTPGTYQVRLFNGSYLPIAVSAPLSVN
jgi:uncharacterized protein RhaS with RHS repeats